jgi:uroporphyrinogen-III synthase
VLTHLLSGAEGPLEGRRIVVQLHGDPLPDLVTGLRRSGAEVLTVPVYRWELPDDVAPVHRLVADVIAGGIDAVTFTSAPAVAGLLTVAEGDGVRAELVAALRERVAVFAVGPVTAGPLDAEGIPSFQPERARLGPLAREVVARLPERDPVLTVGGHTLQVRGHGALIDGRLVELAAGPMAALRDLVGTPGDVVPVPAPVAAELCAALDVPVVEIVGEDGHRLRI